MHSKWFFATCAWIIFAVVAAAAQDFTVRVRETETPLAGVDITVILNQGKSALGTTNEFGELGFDPALLTSKVPVNTPVEVYLQECDDHREVQLIPPSVQPRPEDNSCREREHETDESCSCVFVGYWDFAGAMPNGNLDIEIIRTQTQMIARLISSDSPTASSANSNSNDPATSSGGPLGKVPIVVGIVGGGTLVTAAALTGNEEANPTGTSPTSNSGQTTGTGTTPSSGSNPNPAPPPTPPPPPGFDPNGPYDTSLTVSQDPAGHDPFIRGGQVRSVRVTVNGNTMTIEGAPPWVTVSGPYDASTGNFNLTGSGVVAGFPNVGVSFQGTLNNSGALSGLYTMGVGGELPTSRPIVYQVRGQKR